MSKEEDMQRTLCVEFGGLSVEWDRTGSDYQPLLSGSGWTYLSTGLWVLQQDIDLSGYAMKQKTFYPYSSFEQRGGSTSAEVVVVAPATSLSRQPYVYDYTIVSSVPLNGLDFVAALLTAPGFNLFSGFTDGVGRFDRNQIIHGEGKVYTVDSTIGIIGSNSQDILKLVNQFNFSSLEPTAADKLYCYRIASLISGPGEIDAANLPPSRILLPGTIASEPQLEYMMRLKRSYELANQV